MQGEINRLYVVRLGKIFSNFTILGGIFLLLTALIPFLSFLYIFFLAILIIVFVFVWLFSAGQTSWNISSFFQQEILSDIYSFLNMCLPYVLGVTAAFAIISIVCLVQDRQTRHPVRIVFACIAIVAGIAALAVKLLGGAK